MNENSAGVGESHSNVPSFGVKTAVLAVTVVLLAAIGCGGAGPTDTREDVFGVGATPTLLVDGENGSVVINAATGNTLLGNTITVTATLRDANRIDYEATLDGDTVTVKAKKKGGFRLFSFGQGPAADIEVSAPPATMVEVRTSNGSIELRGIQESGSLRTSNGKVVMENVSGDFDIRTSNGSVTLTAVEGNLTVESSNGAIIVRDGKGTFDIETSNGRIEFSGELTSGGDNTMRTSNGSVTVSLQGEASVELDASSSNGSVTSKLPILITRTQDEKHLVGTIGNGDADLLIRTSNGSVTVQ